jgi:hypothetical protein
MKSIVQNIFKSMVAIFLFNIAINLIAQAQVNDLKVDVIQISQQITDSTQTTYIILKVGFAKYDIIQKIDIKIGNDKISADVLNSSLDLTLKNQNQTGIVYANTKDGFTLKVPGLMNGTFYATISVLTSSGEIHSGQTIIGI